ncbi:MAG: hypothetical protein AB1646_11955 [Thermodesulfobacteriota bacterium]
MEAITEQELKSVYARAAIIQGSLVVSVVVYVVVGELLRMVGYPGSSLGHDGSWYQYIRYALLAVSIILLPIAGFIKSTVIAGAVPENMPSKLMTGAVIAGAFCDAIGMFGLVLFLIAANIVDVYIFAVIALVGHAVFFPRYAEWEERVQPRKW